LDEHGCPGPPQPPAEAPLADAQRRIAALAQKDTVGVDDFIEGGARYMLVMMATGEVSPSDVAKYTQAIAELKASGGDTDTSALNKFFSGAA
jgi:hypothetical protein